MAELLNINEAVRSMIRAGDSTDSVREFARRRGMRLMHEDGLDKVKKGITTYEEILRIVPFESVARNFCSGCTRELHAGFRFCPFCGERNSDAQSEPSNLDPEGVLQP